MKIDTRWVRVASLALVGSAILALPPDASAQSSKRSGAKRGIQCWTDDQGKRMCGDTIPSQYANKEREVFSSQGHVATLPRAKSAEEVAAEKDLMALAGELERRARMSYVSDRYLLHTYKNSRQLEKQRDEVLTSIDYRIKLSEEAVVSAEAAVKELRTRQAMGGSATASVPADASKQLKVFEQSLEDNRNVVELLKKQRQATIDKFARDIKRFEELKALEQTTAKKSPAS